MESRRPSATGRVAHGQDGDFPNLLAPSRGQKLQRNGPQCVQPARASAASASISASSKPACNRAARLNGPRRLAPM